MAPKGSVSYQWHTIYTQFAVRVNILQISQRNSPNIFKRLRAQSRPASRASPQSPTEPVFFGCKSDANANKYSKHLTHWSHKRVHTLQVLANVSSDTLAINHSNNAFGDSFVYTLLYCYSSRLVSVQTIIKIAFNDLNSCKQNQNIIGKESQREPKRATESSAQSFARIAGYMRGNRQFNSRDSSLT